MGYSKNFACCGIIQSQIYVVMGKAEGEDKLWHGHVTALTVSPEYRRLGLARKLMDTLETVSEKM